MVFVKHPVNNKDTILSIKDIFVKYNIKHNKNQNEKYDDNTLSARRLVRLLRYTIQKIYC